MPITPRENSANKKLVKSITHRAHSFNIRQSTFNIQKSSAFTLTEVLIVIALVVLILAMALPAFNFISGGRSIDGAQNEISAYVGMARTGAVGIQEIRGVMFYIDPTTKQVTMAIVRETPTQTYDLSTFSGPYLDLAPGYDTLALPKGISAQVVCNAQVSGGVRSTDGYIGFNTVAVNYTTPPGLPTPVGGVILFDGNGRLISTPYAFRCKTIDSQANPIPTAMGRLLEDPLTTNSVTFIDTTIGTYANPPVSTLGIVLFEDEPFLTQGFTPDDPEFTGPPTYLGTDEPKEEKWLDDNATPLYINRYNGTLVKGG